MTSHRPPLRALDLIRILADHTVDYGNDRAWHTLHTLTRAGALDVVGRPAGAPGYADLRARAVSVEVADLDVLVAGLGDLIAMKRAAGRPLDLQDIADLTKPRA